MPFSQIFPPSPSPTEFIRLFYTSVSLLLSRTQGYCYHLSNSFKCLSFSKLRCVYQLLSYVRLCNPMDCSPPGSSVHGILQVRILEWAAIPFSRGSL